MAAGMETEVIVERVLAEGIAAEPLNLVARIDRWDAEIDGFYREINARIQAVAITCGGTLPPVREECVYPACVAGVEGEDDVEVPDCCGDCVPEIGIALGDKVYGVPGVFYPLRSAEGRVCDIRVSGDPSEICAFVVLDDGDQAWVPTSSIFKVRG